MSEMVRTIGNDNDEDPYQQAVENTHRYNEEVAEEIRKEKEEQLRKALEAKLGKKEAVIKGRAFGPKAKPGNPLHAKINDSDYHIVKAGTYAKGVYLLREECGKDADSVQPTYSKDNSLIRPLTFKEDLIARVSDFNKLTDDHGDARSLDDRLRLFGARFGSCTGIASKAWSTKFKIIIECEPLIRIAKGFYKGYLPIDYNSVAGIELDCDKAKYDELLTRAELIKHPGWLGGVEEDKALLKEYAGIAFKAYRQKYNKDAEKLMGFWAWFNTQQDELRALFVDGRDSLANSDRCLGNSASFLRVARSAKKGGKQ